MGFHPIVNQEGQTMDTMRMQASSLRKGREYRHIGKHYGHFALEYRGRTRGFLTFNCLGCGDTVFLNVAGDGTTDIQKSRS